MPRDVILDSNLLLVLIVGLVSRDHIGKIKRTREFTPEQFGKILEIYEDATSLVTTPNVLTEVSNLLKRVEDTRCHAVLAKIVPKSNEIYVESKCIVKHKTFQPFGLTDLAFLELISKTCHLYTSDHKLFCYAINYFPGCVFNISHVKPVVD